MSATKTTLTEKELGLFSKMYELQMLKLSIKEGNGTEFDSYFEPDDLTAYAFDENDDEEGEEGKITFVMYFKSWAADHCYPKLSGKLSDGRYIEELSERERKTNKEYKNAFKKAYRATKPIFEVDDLKVEHVKMFFPTLYTYVIYSEKNIVELSNTLLPFQDIFHPNSSGGIPKMPTNCYSEKMINKFLSELEQ
jgi:hypothetical protein